MAWSHIYLGRIDDVGGDRQDAIVQYKKALLFQDGQKDTLQAAESGLKAPYRLPGQEPAPGNTKEQSENGKAKKKPAPKLNLELPSTGVPQAGSPD